MINPVLQKKIEKPINCLFDIVQGICQVALFFMIIMVTVQVVVRIFNGNIAWCEEVMLILMDLLLFLLLPVGIKMDLHISVEVFAKRFPKSIKVFLVYFSNAILLLISACMIIYGEKLTSVKSTFPQTGLPRKYLYFITIGSGILCSIVLIAKLFGLFTTDSQKKFLECNNPMEGVSK